MRVLRERPSAEDSARQKGTPPMTDTTTTTSGPTATTSGPPTMSGPPTTTGPTATTSGPTVTTSGPTAAAIPARPAPFDPDALADLETRMWKAYYRRQPARLFGLLILALREQAHASWPR